MVTAVDTDTVVQTVNWPQQGYYVETKSEIYLKNKNE